MDSKYPNLTRPQKRRYFSIKTSASTMKGNAELDIDDSNTWFKNLDSPSDFGEELPPLPPSPTFTPVEKEEKTGNPVEKEEKTGNPVEKERREPSSVPETGEVVPQGEEMHKEGRAESTFLDTESPFKKHAPIKTSSPMKRQEGDEDKDRTASPLLLTCDDDDDDDEDDHGPVKQPITALTPQCNRQAADGGYDAVLDSPPCRFSVGKQKTPSRSVPKKEETPWKLTLSLCSIVPEPEEPPQTSPCPAVEPKEQPVPGKKSLARPSEKKSLARPSEKESLAQPSEKESLAQPSEKESLAQPSEKESLAQPSEKESLAQPSEKESLDKPSEKKSLAQPSEKKSLAQPSEKKSLAQPSEKKSLAQPSEKKSLAQPSEKKSLAQPSEKKSLAQPSEKKSLAQPPEKKSLAQPPEKKSLAQPPEKKSLAQPPEKKSLAQPPEKKSLAQPSEKKSLAQPSEKKSLAQPSEKKSLAQPPEKESLAQPPEKESLAQPPEKESLAQPPEKESLAQPPEKRSLAQPPEKKSRAQPPEKKSRAQPPEKKSLAQPSEKKSLAQPSEKKSLAQPPEKESLAQPPEKKSLAQPPEKKSRAQPPEKKSRAQPPEKKSRAQPPEKKSRAQPPEKESLAQPPEKESLAQPPEKKSLAQPSEKKSLAQPSEKKSLAQPPEKESLAQPPEKESLAQPPEKESLAQPPEKESLAQPPEKESLAQPPEKEATPERKATSSFLQKLREAGQSKPAWKALASPVREAPLTDLEDDFLILEDDGPSWFSLRRKTDPNRTTATPQPQQKDQSHSNNDASADTLTKASQSEKDTAKLRSGGTAEVKTKEKNATGGSSLIPVLTKSTARKKRDSSPQGDGPVEVDHIEQDLKKKVNNPLSEPTTAGYLEPGRGAKPKPSQSKARTKTEKKVPRISQFQAGIQGNKVNPKTSRGRGLQSGKTRRLSAGAGEEPVSMGEESEAASDQDVSPVLQLAPTGQRRVKVPANRKAKEVGPSPTGEADSSQAGQLTQLAGKRKRIKPGPWWLTSLFNTQVTETVNTHTANKYKHNNKKTKTKPARYSSVESGQEEGTSRPLFNQNAKKKPSSNQTAENKPLSNQTTENKPWSNQTAEHKAEKPKRGRTKKQKTTSREEPARPEGQREEEEAEASTAEQQEEQQELGGLSPMPSPLRQHTLTPSEKVFDWIYTRPPKCKPQSDITPHSATVTPSRQGRQAREAPEKRSRRRKAPGNWWVTNNPPENADSTSSFPQQPLPYPKKPSPPQPQPNPKTRKVERSKFLGPPQNGNTASSTRPGGVQTPLMRKDLSAPKMVKRSLASIGSVFSSGRGALPVATVRSSTRQTLGRKTLFPIAPEEQSAQSPSIGLSSGPANDPSQDPTSDRSSSPVDLSASTVCIEPVGQLGKKKTIHRDFSQSNNRFSGNTFKSGPSSMIELEDYEENDNICVQSFRVTPHPSVPPGIVLSDPEAVAELCAPPLRAITLQLEDKANLTDWMALLWPATGKQGGQISPDHFQWFSYRDRALGYKMDLLAETFSNGKILLGSYMKKPLLVDHSATTVYNLLTSSVTVKINGKENHYNPGQTFMVPCGHAYSLHNLTQEPAALHFTRMLAESSE
ncbi:serine/arginine repetitive matrix protein 2 isoform X2 [Oncorhynchus nerka]|uniref:serine/arginine repetitive matrix protein 2 isoform X2 n=1 Tax=Oncorhynchus nerka TaxID=8023 RepID=UPI0031B84188